MFAASVLRRDENPGPVQAVCPTLVKLHNLAEYRAQSLGEKSDCIQKTETELMAFLGLIGSICLTVTQT